MLSLVVGWEGSCFSAVDDFQINQIGGLAIDLEIGDGVKIRGNMLLAASQANRIA